MEKVENENQVLMKEEKLRESEIQIEYQSRCQEFLNYLDIKNQSTTFVPMNNNGKNWQMHTLIIESDTQEFDTDLFCLHGFNLTGHCFQPVSKHLENKFKRIILIDNIGNGGSSRDFDPECQDIDSLHEFIVSMMCQIFAQFKPKDFCILAHSMGGQQMSLFYLWNLKNRMYTIHKFQMSSAWGYTGLARFEEDEKKKGCCQQNQSQLPWKCYQRVTYDMTICVRGLQTLSCTQSMINKQWEMTQLKIKDKEMLRLQQSLINFNMTQPVNQTFTAAKLVVSEVDVAVEGLAEKFDEFDLEKGRLIMMMGDQDWQHKSGLEQMESQEKMTIVVFKDCMHHVHADQPKMMADYIIEDFGKQIKDN